MNIKELEFGNVVKLRNGEICLIHPFEENLRDDRRLDSYIKCVSKRKIYLRNLKTGDLSRTFEYYDNDLNHLNRYLGDEGYEIMEVYKDYTLQEQLWKREEEDEDGR